MSVEHDEEFLDQAYEIDADEFAKIYHEHMELKRQTENDRLQSLAIEQECKICNYSFQGLVPCKCHMRVSADVFQAVVDKYESSKA